MDLKQYLKNRDFTFFICTGVLASQVLLICDVIISAIIFPIINKLFFHNRLSIEHYNNTIENKDDVDDRNNPIIININGVNINLGKIIYTILRLVIIIFVLKFIFTILV